jgi:putative acetyltransferase
MGCSAVSKHPDSPPLGKRSGDSARDTPFSLSMATVIRTSSAQDRPAILEVVRQAFRDDQTRDGHEEVDIVTSTWARQASPPGFELVAEDGKRIVGHVLAAVGDLGGRPAVGIAPLSVVPRRQRQGVGTALMTELLARIERGGWPLALLLGNPAYYGRFGFEASATYGITYRPVGAGNPHFMVRIFSPDVDDQSGDFTYGWEIGS